MLISRIVDQGDGNTRTQLFKRDNIIKGLSTKHNDGIMKYEGEDVLSLGYDLVIL